MIKKLLFILIGTIVLLAPSCKSEFETIRSQGSAEERLTMAREYLEKEECYKAQTLFESVIGAYRGLPEQEGIYFDYAQSHFCQGSYLTSAHYFNNFATTYPNSNKREEADYMVAFSYYSLSPDYKLEQTYTQKAINQFQLFINTHPNSDRVADANKHIDDCREKLEQKAFAEGKLYYDLKQFEAATVSFKNLLKDFPETPNAERVRYLIAKAGYKWAENSILIKQAERYTMANSDAETFLARHTSSQYTREVKFILNDSSNKVKELTNE